ncbi:MAG TPA: gliding motility-associated C-terminal domain-containing protein [Bacteroidales bacterium]|nr:gliding motility-associated C-terminal domain-containing protein [Bacteroidales bacterium]
MASLYKRLIILLLVSSVIHTAGAQTDINPPAPPVLRFLTLHPETGYTELQWIKSPSPDVAGYVIYYFNNNEGFAIDTVYNPNATSYINTGSAARFREEKYVIAAIDSSGNVSPLSNPLNTIYLTVTADTCLGIIRAGWNQYTGSPVNLTGYTIAVSENNGDFYEKGTVDPGKNSFSIEYIEPGVSYCAAVRAVLEGGLISSSNVGCLTVDMLRNPSWINADFATVEDGLIKLSFTVDPLSESTKYNIERKAATDSVFRIIKTLTTSSKSILYSDPEADVTKRYIYRLASLNSCGNVTKYSNPASNILAELAYENNKLILKWNKYNRWTYGISEQTLYADFGNGYAGFISLSPADSVLEIPYKDIMYSITGKNFCFYISAIEAADITGLPGQSISNVVCAEADEKIFVPNTFTPDNDGKNDYFSPVLSFTPSSYKLLITDRRNNIIFESSNPGEQWDGRNRSGPVPNGVYLWYLSVKTPSGKDIRKSGTITVIRNF